MEKIRNNSVEQTYRNIVRDMLRTTYADDVPEIVTRAVIKIKEESQEILKNSGITPTQYDVAFHSIGTVDELSTLYSSEYIKNSPKRLLELYKESCNEPNESIKVLNWIENYSDKTAMLLFQIASGYTDNGSEIIHDLTKNHLWSNEGAISDATFENLFDLVDGCSPYRAMKKVLIARGKDDHEIKEILKSIFMESYNALVTNVANVEEISEIAAKYKPSVM